MTTADTTFCANHPQTPTALRCNKCGKPICTKCVVRTPVGYRCRECVRGQQQIFETAAWYDYAIAVVVTTPLAAMAGALVTALGFYSIFLAPVAGGAIAEVVRFAVRRRRGRYLSLVAAGAFALGGLLLALFPVGLAFFSFLMGEGLGAAGLLLGAIWPTVYAVLGAGTIYARLRGISIN